jgi:superfamily II DNA or RNA helicase
MSENLPKRQFPPAGIALQEGVTREIIAAVKNGEDLLIVAPTGFGKTKILADGLIQMLAADPEFSAVILQNRQALANQNHQRAIQFGVDPKTALVVMDGDIAADAAERRLVYALPDTIVGKTGQIGARSLIAIDEAHHAIDDDAGEMNSVISDFCRMNKAAVVIGTTATPYPPEGSQLCSRLQNARRVVVTYHEAIEAGMITGVQTERADYRLNDGSYLREHIAAHIDDRRVEDTRAGLNSSIGKLRPENFDEIVIARDIVRNGEQTTQTLHFTDTIQEAEARKAALEAVGIKVATLHSGNSDAQNLANVEAYQRGEIHHLASVDMIGEGFDAPCTELIILSKKTTSRSEFNQIAGRSQRIFGDKAFGRMRDYGASTDLHGSIEEFVKAQHFVMRGGRTDAWCRLQKEPLVQGLCVGKDVYYAVATRKPDGNTGFSVMRSYIDHKTKTRRIEPVDEPTTKSRFMSKRQLTEFTRTAIAENETAYIRLRTIKHDVTMPDGTTRSMSAKNLILGAAWKDQRESAVRMARGTPINEAQFAEAKNAAQDRRSIAKRDAMLQKVKHRSALEI